MIELQITEKDMKILENSKLYKMIEEVEFESSGWRILPPLSFHQRFFKNIKILFSSHRMFLFVITNFHHRIRFISYVMVFHPEIHEDMKKLIFGGSK